MLNYREFQELIDGASSQPDWGEAYTLLACPMGARVASASSGSTITVDAPHGFKAGDKFLRNPGSDNEFSAAVSSVTSTTIVFSPETYSVSVGDLLVNLGPDTGSSTPNYDGSPFKIYSDPDGGTVVSNSIRTLDSKGRNSYYYRGAGRHWELLRNSNGTPTRVVRGFGSVASYMDPADFGAAYDGSTNDAGALVAAKNALPSGGEIRIPPDVNMLLNTDDLAWDVSGIVVSGSNQSSKLTINNAGDVFNVSADRCEFRNLEIAIGSTSNRTGSLFNITAEQGSVIDCRFSGKAAINNGIIATHGDSAADNWTYRGIRIPGSVTWTKFLHIGASSGTVKSTHVSDSFISNTILWSDCCINLDTGAETFTCTGSEIGGGGANTGPIIHCEDTDAGQDPRWIHFADCFLEAGAAARIFDIDAARHVHVSGCYLRTALIGAHISAGTDIRFQNSYFSDIEESGVDLDGGTKIDFDHCTFEDCSQATTDTSYGVDVAAGVSQWSVSHCRFRKSTETNIIAAAINIASGASARYQLSNNDYGVAGTDYGSAGDRPVLDASTSTNVVLGSHLPFYVHRGNAAVTNTGDTNENDIVTGTILAGTLGIDDGIRMTAGGTCSGTAGIKTIKAWFGTSVIAQVSLDAAEEHSWFLFAELFNSNSVTAQTVVGFSTHTADDTESAADGDTRVQSGNLGIPTTADVEVKITIQNGNTGDSVVLRTWNVEIVKRQ